jgi:predicted transglutaminase-like cysteine proteinase
MFKFAVLAACTTLAICAAPLALANSVSPTFIPVGEVADAPAGFTEMCMRDRKACGLRDDQDLAELQRCVTAGSANPAIAAVTQATCDAATLKTAAALVGQRPAGGTSDSAESRYAADSLLFAAERINRGVNYNVIQRTDLQLFGTDEFWRRSGSARGSYGDCEDIALEKRAQLIAAGHAENRLFLAVVYKRRAGLHTVLVVRTDEGDMVLDSLSSRIRRWDRSGYFWIRVQAPGKPYLWMRAATA